MDILNTRYPPVAGAGWMAAWDQENLHFTGFPEEFRTRPVARCLLKLLYNSANWPIAHATKVV